MSVAVLAVLWSLACQTQPEQSSGGASPAATSEVADLMIVNGRVFTADEQGTMAQAVAVKGNTILRVGSDAELAALRGPETRVVDAQGATVAPGFNDAHVHFLSGGLSLGDVDLAGLTTLRQVQAAISTFAAGKPADAVGQGPRLALFAVPRRAARRRHSSTRSCRIVRPS